MDAASMAKRVILRICSSENGLSFALLKASSTLSNPTPLSTVMPLCFCSASADEALSGTAMLILPPLSALTMELSEL